MPLPVDTTGREVVADRNGYDVASAPSESVFARICRGLGCRFLDSGHWQMPWNVPDLVIPEGMMLPHNLRKTPSFYTSFEIGAFMFVSYHQQRHSLICPRFNLSGPSASVPHYLYL